MGRSKHQWHWLICQKADILGIYTFVPLRVGRIVLNIGLGGFVFISNQ